MSVYIDFETRSKVDITKCGAWVYSDDPSTSILCFAYAVTNEEPVIVSHETLEKEETFLTLSALIVSGEMFVAHNAFFEQSIWRNIMVKRHGYPDIPIEQWRCTMAKSLAAALPRNLEKVCLALDLVEKKDMEGSRTMLKLSKPRRPTKNDPDTWHSPDKYPDDFAKLYKYCRQDVIATRSLDRKLPNLSPFETRVWELDQTINFRGIQVDTAVIRAALSLIEYYEKVWKVKVYEATDGKLDNIRQIKKVIEWIKEQGIQIENLQKDTVDTILKQKDLPENVNVVLSARQQLGRTSTKKYQTMLNASGRDGRLRDILTYHSATTGRWGGKLVQLQNLPRGRYKSDVAAQIVQSNDHNILEMSYEDPMEAISSAIRGAIVSKSGYTLLVADYAAIEARVLFWLANETGGVKAFQEGRDLYVEMASEIYGKPTNQITKEERFLGKTAVLGCGYQMGPVRFRDTCVGYGMDVSEGLARKAVDSYREKFKAVKSLWYDTEKTAIAAIREGRSFRCGRTIWAKRGEFLVCKLPSGRAIVYFQPMVSNVEGPFGPTEKLSFRGINSQTRQFEKQDTYGGKLVENMVQATARDIMAWAMLHLEKAGYRIVLSVHDEIVCEVEESPNKIFSKYTVNEMIHIMCSLPEWAKGCPIKAEGWKGRRYKK
jgi:DNA polymerase bacteriophage-type